MAARTCTFLCRASLSYKWSDDQLVYTAKDHPQFWFSNEEQLYICRDLSMQWYAEYNL